MKILVKIDQQEALRQGINAPASTHTFDIHPKELSAEQREVLAAVLIHGYDATHRGIKKDCPSIAGQQFHIGNSGGIHLYGNDYPTGPIIAYGPCKQYLLEGIDRLLAERAEFQAQKRAAKAAEEEELRQKLAKLAQRPTQNYDVYFYRGDSGGVKYAESSPCSGKLSVKRVVTAPSRYPHNCYQFKGTPLEAAYENYLANAKEAFERAVAAVEPEAERELAELEKVRESQTRRRKYFLESHLSASETERLERGKLDLDEVEERLEGDWEHDLVCRIERALPPESYVNLCDYFSGEDRTWDDRDLRHRKIVEKALIEYETVSGPDFAGRLKVSKDLGWGGWGEWKRVVQIVYRSSESEDADEDEGEV